MEDLASFYINEEFVRTSVSSAEHDRLLADGWRHFGRQFFRYNLALHEDEIRLVIPLRIRLSGFRLAQSQERILRKNSDIEVKVGPVKLTDDILDLFDRHKQRFKQHTPESIFTFIAERPEDEPCATFQQTLRIGERIVGVGFFDIGKRSVSAIYTAFDPDETRRSLGVFTILKEIEFAAEKGMKFYYLGYSYSGRSFYDYKKRFHGTEAFEWNSVWSPVPREV
ncbi:MAG: GNAT family N-acetyltransferase [Acidobacteria bacterium]|nr:GNAT family N-acetyltransferase [Acidobacteriota bacterium]